MEVKVLCAHCAVMYLVTVSSVRIYFAHYKQHGSSHACEIN